MTKPDLDAAFRATCYRVETPEREFDLRIGVLCPAFDDVVRRLGASRWGLLTAYNPGGGICSEDDNVLRQRRLLQRLRSLPWICLPACHVADDPMWPDEPSVLIVQIGEAELCALASEFFQLAVVCGEVGAAPRLAWIREAC